MKPASQNTRDLADEYCAALERSHAKIARMICADDEEAALAAIAAAPQAVIGMQNEQGQSLLHLAASRGRTRACQALLAAGADPNDENFDGDSSLRWAAANNHETIVAMFCRHQKGAPDTLALVMAVENNAHAAANILIKHGADADRAAVDFILRGEFEHGRWLIGNGACNVDRTLGLLTIDTMAGADTAQAICYLVDHGADVNAAAPKLLTEPNGPVLHAFARHGAAAPVQRLLELGADPLLPDGQGETALQVAAGPARRVLLAWHARQVASTAVDAYRRAQAETSP
jgi:hypothetical protein